MAEERDSAEAQGRARACVQALQAEMARVVSGQHELVQGMLVCLLGGGHVLLEGCPGLGKTLAAKTLAGCVGGRFSRIQFTPDLLPSDIVGYQLWRAERNALEVQQGPVAANVVLADEINRAPAKVQSALLEAMEERQVTVAGTTFALPTPFMVLATENPLEQQGTYALPEAQKDRFMMKIRLGYLSRRDEMEMMVRMGCGAEAPTPRQVASTEDILALRRCVQKVHLDGRLLDYVLDLVVATRPGQGGELSGRQAGVQLESDRYIDYGASPRGCLCLISGSKALALLNGRDFVVPEDIRSLAVPVLAHRLSLSFEAEAQHVNAVQVVEGLVEKIRIP